LGWLNAFAWEHAVARAAVSFSFAKSTSSHRRDGWGACNTEEIAVRIPLGKEFSYNLGFYGQ